MTGTQASGDGTNPSGTTSSTNGTMTPGMGTNAEPDPTGQSTGGMMPGGADTSSPSGSNMMPGDPQMPDDGTPSDPGMMPDDSPDEMMPDDAPDGMMPDDAPDEMMPDDSPDEMMPDDMMPDEGPVEGAYEACSGEAPPALALTPVLEGLNSPINAVTPPGDSQTMFVLERTGALKRFDLSAPDAGTELLSVNSSANHECGAFSIALHPNFDGAAESRIYISYMPTCPSQFFEPGGSSALDEYTIDGDTATLSRSFFSVDQPEGNHNGGGLAFGPDGYLYYGLGDGGFQNDEHGENGNGQNVNTPLGSILRFDVDAPDVPPAGNLTSEQAGGASVDARIMHYGVRNPWRFSFDRSTGDMYIGDVGQNTWEEISFVESGGGPQNFGWAAREGFEACPGCSVSLLPGTTATDPIHSYATPGSGGGFFNASVTGGFVYRGREIPGLIGRYIFGDYVRGDIMALTYDGQGGACDVVEELIPGANVPAESLVSFAEDSDGEVYVVNMSRGSILKITAQ